MLHKTILGIDPGTRYMGLAVIRGPELLAYGVHTLRNGTRPHDVIGQARHIVLQMIARHAPDVVAIEEPLAIATKRAALMSVIVDELRSRAEELSLGVVELSPRAVREAVVGNLNATKFDVAAALIAGRYGELKALVPKRPVRSGLGLGPKDKYWLHMFDALAVALAADAPRASRAAPEPQAPARG